jgi:hypothetical protein
MAGRGARSEPSAPQSCGTREPCWVPESTTRQSQEGSCLGTRSPSLDFVPHLFLAWGMPLLLRKSSAQARIEGWDPRNRSDDDYAVVDDTIVGRIYREMIIGKPKWRWFVQQIPEAGPGRPVPPPNQGMADTLDEAKAAFAKRYEEVKRGGSACNPRFRGSLI